MARRMPRETLPAARRGGAAARPLRRAAARLERRAQKSLGGKIERKKDQIQWRKGRERVLSTDIAGYTRRINALQGEITTLQTRQVRLQTSLDAKRAELARIQEDLRRERLRLARLRKRAWPRRARRSPPASSSSTRPTSPTS